MIKIYPSILETNINIFKSRLQRYLTIFDHLQIDIADGQFVANKTIQLNDILLIIKQFSNSAINKVSFEIHLMVKEWQNNIPKIQQLSKLINIKTILIHLKVFNNKQFNNLRTEQFNIGIVLNPEDDVILNIKTIKNFSVCQIMTINPGRQGQAFIPQMLYKIEQLRINNYSGKIILDGAINNKTLPLIKSQRFLPDAVCPGSYFHNDPCLKLKILNQIINQA